MAGGRWVPLDVIFAGTMQAGRQPAHAPWECMAQTGGCWAEVLPMSRLLERSPTQSSAALQYTTKAILTLASLATPSHNRRQ
jgi:hypothetical protein